MILLYENEGIHLVRSMGKDGMTGILIRGYCGNSCRNIDVIQLPDKWISRACKKCLEEMEKT